MVTVAVFVAVADAVAVMVAVALDVAVTVNVGVGTAVSVGVTVAVGVGVNVIVAVLVAVAVGVAVLVGSRRGRRWCWGQGGGQRWGRRGRECGGKDGDLTIETHHLDRRLPCQPTTGIFKDGAGKSKRENKIALSIGRHGPDPALHQPKSQPRRLDQLCRRRPPDHQ